MPAPTSIKLDFIIHSLSSDNPSLSVLQRRLKGRGYIVSKSAINNSLKQKGKRRQARLNGKVFKVERKRSILTQEVLRKLKKRYSVENPPPYRRASGSMRLALSTTNRGVLQVLGMKKKMKRKVQVLSERECENRKQNCQKLYRGALRKEDIDYVVTLDETWIPVPKYKPKTDHFYVSKANGGEGRSYVKPCKETFQDKFMVVGSMCSSRVFPLIKVPQSVTVKSQYFVDHVLKPLIHQQLIPHFKEEIGKVVIHFDKATSHTAKNTYRYLLQVKEQYGISYLEKDHIPVKRADVSPCDFFAFGYLKQCLNKSHARTAKGVWTRAKSIWSSITPQNCSNTFAAWKQRCLTVTRRNGEQCESTSDIHRRKLRL